MYIYRLFYPCHSQISPMANMKTVCDKVSDLSENPYMIYLPWFIMMNLLDFLIGGDVTKYIFIFFGMGMTQTLKCVSTTQA